MDPNACWNELLETIADTDSDGVTERAEGLLKWLDHGGFPPRGVLGTDLGTQWDAAVARFACEFALSRIDERRRTLPAIDRAHPESRQ